MKPVVPAGRVVAITGANTFLGRRLAQHLPTLSSIKRVVLLDHKRRPTHRHLGDKVSTYCLNLTEDGADQELAQIFEREDVDTVVHLAFKNRPTHDADQRHALESVGTMYVQNACASQRVNKFILGSSTYCYGAKATHPSLLLETHPLNNSPGPFTHERIEAERQTRRFAEENPACVTTTLRVCTVLGPTVENLMTDWLTRRIAPTALGFDPLLQFIHEDDLVAGFTEAITHDHPGVFNLVGDGVIALSTVMRAARVLPAPIPYGFGRTAFSALFATSLTTAPGELFDFLRFSCIADGQKLRREFAIAPRYSSQQALIDYLETTNLRRLKASNDAFRVAA